MRRNLFSIQNEHAFVRRQWEWAGLKFSDRVAYLKGMVLAKPGSKRKALYGYDPFLRELHLSTYHLSAETAPDYVEAMKKYNVTAIYGYPSSVYPVAKICLDKGLDLKLKSALLTAENLHESHKETIAKAFGCKVFDFYGAAERVCYVMTCNHGNYHVVPEYGLTEYLPVENAEDGRVRIVATGFWNKPMPLIRYDSGDMLITSDKKCPCSRAFPVVETIIGRECDMIVTPTGRMLGPSILTALVYVVCGANHFMESQIIQDALDHVTIEYVPTRDCTPEYLAGLKKKLEEYFPEDLSFDMKKVVAVQRTQGGKITAVVSKIGSPGT
jgi:phenylacetate-CoA ligase